MRATSQRCVGAGRDLTLATVVNAFMGGRRIISTAPKPMDNLYDQKLSDMEASHAALAARVPQPKMVKVGFRYVERDIPPGTRSKARAHHKRPTRGAAITGSRFFQELAALQRMLDESMRTSCFSRMESLQAISRNCIASIWLHSTRKSLTILTTHWNRLKSGRWLLAKDQGLSRAAWRVQ